MKIRGNANGGITLIALIITIIVLLILAGISISLIMNGGIINRATQARVEYKIAEEKEKIGIAYQEYKIAKTLTIQEAVVTGNETNGWTITFDETGNIYKLYADGTIEKVEEEVAIEPTDVYVTLYTDGTLGFSSNQGKIEGKTVLKEYENINGKTFNYSNRAPWYEDRENIKIVEIQNEIVPNETSYWFFDCTYLKNINNIHNLKTDNVTNMSWMFGECKNLTELDLSKFNTSNVTTMFSLFCGCSGLTKLDLSSFDTSNVESMSQMFTACYNLEEVNLKNFKTNKVTDMTTMFNFCNSLEKLDLSSFDTSNVISMSMMFANCSSLTNLDLKNFDTSNVENIASMFDGCNSLAELDLNNFDISKVTWMSGMFSNCSSLIELDLSNFNTSKVTDISRMFSECNKLKVVYGRRDRWITTSVTDSKDMWLNCGTDHITFKTYLENDKIVGYEIRMGASWTVNANNITSRTVNNKRASSIHIIQLDPEKTYTIKMNNSNYDYGYHVVDLDFNVLLNSGWVSSSNTRTISGAKYIVTNFRQKNEKVITDEMIDEIIEGIEIKLVQ